MGNCRILLMRMVFSLASQVEQRLKSVRSCCCILWTQLSEIPCHLLLKTFFSLFQTFLFMTRTRLQNKNVTDLNADLFTGLFDGIGSSLIGGIPATSVFFACKDFTMDLLKSYPTVSLPLATGISVCLANIPYWIVRTPSEVAKTRLQLKLSKFNSNISLREKIKNYYRGFLPNVWYSLPSDLLKFVICKDLFFSSFKIVVYDQDWLLL